MRVTIDQLQAAGMTDSQIVKLMKERELERREQNRKAQINHRSRQHEGDLRSDIADSHIDTSSRDLERKKRKKVSISADWKPTDADRDYARSKGWPDARIDTEAERFRIHYLANAKPWADWHLVWCKWVTSSYQNSNVGHGGQQHGRRHGSVLDALDRLGERLNAEGSFADQYVPGSSGPTPLRLDQDVRPTGFKLVSKG